MKRDSTQTTLGSLNPDQITSLRDIDWTFEGADTQQFTHGLHNYPARMVPQIVNHLLSFYKNEGVIEEGDLVYDPFAGSGTTAVEARLHGLHAEGNDINPFAVMLSKAKAIPLDRGTLVESRSALLDGLDATLDEVAQRYEREGSLDDVALPDVNDGWFPQPQLYQLAAIRDRIDGLEAEFGADYARFYRIALSHVTRRVSYQRNGEFKRYRMAKEDRPDHDPDAFSLFAAKVDENVSMMKAYSERVDHSLETTIHAADSRSATAEVGEDVADIVITSPPYGDHSTTVAYGQFSQDPALLTGTATYDEMRSVDKTGLGGAETVVEPLSELENWSPSLAATLDTLGEKDGREDDALNFFTDYYAVMEEVADIVKPGQPVAWVVANRTMSRVTIPTHLITRELCEHLGYEFVDNLPREIPNKTLPWENAPENVAGTKGDLMAEENIVVMRAPTA